MNSCGQHGIAQIGFHGSSMKVNGKIMPTIQVLLGGGSTGNGEGRAADKVIKVPSKRAPQVLRTILNDYTEKQSFYASFLNYYDELGKDYFYQLLKPIADQENVTDDEFVDWGQKEEFIRAIGVGECAGVLIDLVATLIFETEEKYGWALEAFENEAYADAVYNAYNTFVNGAKALLLDKGVSQSTQIGVIKAFDEHFAAEFGISSFNDLVLQINKNEPSLAFAEAYLAEANDFLNKVKAFRPSPELA
jgi:sulfite reductase (ferredoxin)